MRNITLNMVTRHILTRASSKYHSKNNDPSPIIPPETTVQEQASAMVEEIKTYCQAKGFDPYYVLNDNDTEYLAARLGSGESPSKVKKSFVDHAKQTVDYCCEDEEWLKLQNRLGEAAQKDLTDKLYQTISGHTKSTGFVLAISLALVGAAGAVMDDCLYDGVNHIDNPFRVYSSNPSDDVIKNTKNRLLVEQLTDGFIVDGDGNVVYASSLVKNASLDYNPVLKTTCKMLNTGCDQPPIMVYGSHAYNGTDGITPLGYTEFMKLLEDGDGKELVFPVQGQSSSDFEDLSKAIAEAITYYSEETNPEGTVVDMFPNAQATYENPIMDCTGASIRFASTFNLENSATLVEICFIEGEDGRYIMHAWNPVFVSSPEDYQTESFLHDGTPGYGKYSPKIIETLLGGQAGKLIGYAEPSSGNFYGPSVIQLLNTYPVTAFNNKHVVEFDYPIELAQASDETSPTTTIAQKWTDTLVTMKDLYKFFNVTSLQELESKHRVYPTEQTG